MENKRRKHSEHEINKIAYGMIRQYSYGVPKESMQKLARDFGLTEFLPKDNDRTSIES